MRRVLLALLVLLAACSSSAKHNTASPSTRHADNATTTTTTAKRASSTRVVLTTIASGLNSPVAIAWRAHDPRPYVAEQPGRVRIVANGRALPTPVLSLPVSHGNEQGLLGLTFSSDGTKLYVDYTDPTGDSHIVEYTMRGDIADPASR